jgi:Holliday junction resolvasome RuvABC endonuclease subunit
MRYVPIVRRRILAVDPVSRGFGFVVLEEPLRLIDWGVVQCRKRKRVATGWSYTRSECIRKIAKAIVRYEPTMIVFEDCGDESSRRCHSVELFLGSILKLAKRNEVKIRTFSRAQIRQAFLRYGPTTKEDIARVVGNYFPELLPLPKHRTIDMTEDYRMSIFDAMSLILTCFANEE